MSQATDLKQAARATWAAGDYDVVVEKILGVGEDIVDRLDITADDEVLDVACGTGNATVPAARKGARTVGLDITPELLDKGRVRAAAAGVDIEWVAGDAENLPYADEGFDAVISVFGCMFAPDHEAAARELARVLGPGGRMGICSWTPEGATGEFFKTVGSHMPPPPAPSPLLWGTEEHVRELLEPHGVELEMQRRMNRFDFDSVEDAVSAFATYFGPVVKARELLEPQGKWEALRDDITAFFAARRVEGEDRIEYDGEYLVVVGRKP